jgi:hypothetical protein
VNPLIPSLMRAPGSHEECPGSLAPPPHLPAVGLGGSGPEVRAGCLSPLGRCQCGVTTVLPHLVSQFAGAGSL